MINYNIIPQVVYEIGMLKTMSQLQAVAEFASNLSANICLLLAI